MGFALFMKRMLFVIIFLIVLMIIGVYLEEKSFNCSGSADSYKNCDKISFLGIFLSSPAIILSTLFFKQAVADKFQFLLIFLMAACEIALLIIFSLMIFRKKLKNTEHGI